FSQPSERILVLTSARGHDAKLRPIMAELLPSSSFSPSSFRQDTVHIDLGERSYEIRIGSGLLDDPDSFAGLPKSGTALIVTNTTVGPLYAARLRQALQAHHKKVLTVELP